MVKVRCNIHRMNYTVDPGLYALGNPDRQSPVLVSANYKYSFDLLRKALPGRNLWILVLDTKGVNVWCAAGKGTFGSRELIQRIGFCRLKDVVSHRKLILPQLSAPGVSAHLVNQISGFRVIYGPIKSTDLPAFMDNGLKATPEMRLKTFSLRERIVLVPTEIILSLKVSLMIMAGLFLAGGLGGPGTFLANAGYYGMFAVMAFAVSHLAGSLLTPLLLPWLPGRAFSVKGLTAGIVASAAFLTLRIDHWNSWPGRLEILGLFLMMQAVTVYLALNFTGASTYTSMSGVRKEMKWSIPFQIAAVFLGAVSWLSGRLLS